MRPPPAHNLINRIVGLTLCLLVFGGTLGLGAVWVRQEIFATANRSLKLDRQIADCERYLDEVQSSVAVALSPRALLARNESLGLDLQLPREIQVVRLAGSPEMRLAARRNREIFSVASASLVRSASRSAPVFTLAANR